MASSRDLKVEIQNLVLKTRRLLIEFLDQPGLRLSPSLMRQVEDEKDPQPIDKDKVKNFPPLGLPVLGPLSTVYIQLRQLLNLATKTNPDQLAPIAELLREINERVFGLKVNAIDSNGQPLYQTRPLELVLKEFNNPRANVTAQVNHLAELCSLAVSKVRETETIECDKIISEPSKNILNALSARYQHILLNPELKEPEISQDQAALLEKLKKLPDEKISFTYKDYKNLYVFFLNWKTSFGTLPTPDNIEAMNQLANALYGLHSNKKNNYLSFPDRKSRLKGIIAEAEALVVLSPPFPVPAKKVIPKGNPPANSGISGAAPLPPETFGTKHTERKEEPDTTLPSASPIANQEGNIPPPSSVTTGSSASLTAKGQALGISNASGLVSIVEPSLAPGSTLEDPNISSTDTHHNSGEDKEDKYGPSSISSTSSGSGLSLALSAAGGGGGWEPPRDPHRLGDSDHPKAPEEKKELSDKDKALLHALIELEEAIKNLNKFKVKEINPENKTHSNMLENIEKFKPPGVLYYPLDQIQTLKERILEQKDFEKRTSINQLISTVYAIASAIADQKLLDLLKKTGEPDSGLEVLKKVVNKVKLLYRHTINGLPLFAIVNPSGSFTATHPPVTGRTATSATPTRIMIERQPDPTAVEVSRRPPPSPAIITGAPLTRFQKLKNWFNRHRPAFATGLKIGLIVTFFVCAFLTGGIAAFGSLAAVAAFGPSTVGTVLGIGTIAAGSGLLTGIAAGLSTDIKHQQALNDPSRDSSKRPESAPQLKAISGSNIGAEHKKNSPSSSGSRSVIDFPLPTNPVAITNNSRHSSLPNIPIGSQPPRTDYANQGGSPLVAHNMNAGDQSSERRAHRAIRAAENYQRRDHMRSKGLRHRTNEG